MVDSDKCKILSKVLIELGFPSVDMSDFDKRLSYQKIIYILQNNGPSLGYGYNWYIRGPYSPKLTEDLFSIFEDEIIFNNSKSLKFKANSEILKKIHSVRDRIGGRIKDPIFLEILASMLYIPLSALNLSAVVFFILPTQ